MASVNQLYADWKDSYPPSHTSRTIASLAIEARDPQKFVDDFIRMAEKDYPNHQISGKLVREQNNLIGKVVFDPVVAP